ncbi:MAG: hypothetical protein ACKPBB_18105 [Sphaerospermopsis kisseleviana]
MYLREFVVRSQESGVRSQESGVRSHESGGKIRISYCLSREKSGQYSTSQEISATDYIIYF